MYKISKAEEWTKIDLELKQIFGHLPPKILRDLIKMNKNINDKVTQLSIEEIECRRQHKATRRFLETRDECNALIATYEKMITIGALL